MRRYLLASALLLPSLFAQGTLEIGGRLVHYEVRGGYALIHGDIIVGTAAEVEAASQPASSKTSEPRSVVLRFNTATPQMWPGATMYYAIDPTLPNQQRILDAVAHWNTRTHLKILPRTTEPNYVRFVRNTTLDAACSSNLGMIGGQQSIQTTDGCSAGNLIHELGHAFGLLHEQERDDRNAFVTVLYQNIDKRFIYNFDQSAGSRDAAFYDYDSIMLYGATGFSTNLQDSMETVPVGIPIGQRAGLSAGDIDAVERTYGFTPSATTIATAPAGRSIVVDGVTMTAPQSFQWTPGSTHTVGVVTPEFRSGTSDRYVFARWSDGGGASHTITASPDVTVYLAAFQFQHRVTADVLSGQGAVALTPAMPDDYYPDRLPLKVTATPAQGSEFVRWSGTTNLTAFGNSLSATDAVVESVSTDGRYRATFTTTPLTTVDSLPHGLTVVVDGTSYTTPARLAFMPGTPHSITLAAAQTSGNNTAHYQFTQWEDGSSATSRSITAPNGAGSYVATFSTKFLLTGATAGSGSLRFSPSSADGYYDDGAQVNITALPGANATLRYWLGDLAGGTLSQTVIMDQQRYVVAYFGTALPYTILNAASFDATSSFDFTGYTVTPGEIVTVFGSGLGPASLASGQLDSSGNLATTLAGTRVTFDGVAAPLVYSSATQVSAVVPFGIAGKLSTVIRVEYNGTVIGAVNIAVSETAPALFTANASGRGSVAALNQNGSVNSTDNPAAPGDVVVLYATGGGAWTETVPDGKIMDAHLVAPRAPVFVRFGKLPAEIIYVGSAPGLVNGALQINAVLPKELLGGSAVPVQLIVGSYSSRPGTTIAVK